MPMSPPMFTVPWLKEFPALFAVVRVAYFFCVFAEAWPALLQFVLEGT